MTRRNWRSWRGSFLLHLEEEGEAVEVFLFIRPSWLIVGFDVARTGVASVGFIGKLIRNVLVSWWLQDSHRSAKVRWWANLLERTVKLQRMNVALWCKIWANLTVTTLTTVPGVLQYRGAKIQVFHFIITYNSLDSWFARYYWRCKGWQGKLDSGQLF